MPVARFVVAVLVCASAALAAGPHLALDASRGVRQAPLEPALEVVLSGDSASVALVAGILQRHELTAVAGSVDTLSSLQIALPGTHAPVAVSVRHVESGVIMPRETIRVWSLATRALQPVRFGRHQPDVDSVRLSLLRRIGPAWFYDTTAQPDTAR